MHLASNRARFSLHLADLNGGGGEGGGSGVGFKVGRIGRVAAKFLYILITLIAFYILKMCELATLIKEKANSKSSKGRNRLL